MHPISRRSFVRNSLAGTASALIARHFPAAPLPALAKTTLLNQFDYSAIQLLDGPMLEQFRTNHAFFLALSDDSLLQPFRQKAGLPAPGEEMGGWYSWSKDFDPPQNMTGYVPGHTFGQYLSGLSRAYAITGDRLTQEKIASLVRGFGATVTSKFYHGYPLPAYTFDKTNCGLIDAHRYAHDPQALPLLSHATDAVLPWLPPKALSREEMRSRPHPNIAYTWDESYTLPENFFLAYQVSGNPRYLALAKRFLQDDTYFDPLSEGRNVLPGQHAYSHVNALNSAAQAYLTLGSEKHLRAARNGFGFVLDTQSYATGGWGPDETFREPASGDLGASLTQTHASFETPCGAYGHFKISRYLLRVSADSRYGDSMEKVLYNTILGALPIQPDGHSFYYSDYNNSGSKFFHPDKWPCCSGTSPQITADYGISSYFESPDGVYVNLFVPSRLSYRHTSGPIVIEQRTDYPYSPEISLRIQSERPARFSIALRVPAWAGVGTRVAVNGHAVPLDMRPGTFLPIRREWKNGDRIEYHIDRGLRLESVDAQHQNLQALAFGPLTLFAVDSTDSRITREQLMGAKQTGPDSTDWKVESSSGAVTFSSFPALRNRKYRLYQEVTL